MSAFLPWWWRWLALAVLIVAAMAGGARLMYGYEEGRIDELQARFDSFKQEVEVAGRIAEEQRRRAEAQGIAAQAKSNARWMEELAGEQRSSDAAVARMRGAIASLNPGGGSVPSPGTTAAGAEFTVCYSGVVLATGIRASLQRFIEQAADIVRRGAEATDALNEARTWAKEAQGIGKEGRLETGRP